MTHTYHFKHCWVHVSPGYTETVFGDGTSVPAVPQDTKTYRARARALGYGDDIDAMSREHELLHTFLAEACGFGSSPTLWAVAHSPSENVAPVWAQKEEEGLVLAFQAYLNEADADPLVADLQNIGLSPEKLRQDALALVRPSPPFAAASSTAEMSSLTA